MHHHQDSYIRCPFYRDHFMPSLRFTFHLAKCEKNFKKENDGKTVFHCEENYHHIFFDADKLAAHKSVCEKMNTHQTSELYIPDPPKADKSRSSKIKRSRSRDRDDQSVTESKSSIKAAREVTTSLEEEK